MENQEKYELVIIGGGPAGVAAGVYAARKKLKTLIIATDFGGQSIVSDTIENWIGDIEIKGSDLQKKLEDNINFYKSDDFHVKKFQEVVSVEKKEDFFEIKNNLGNVFLSSTVLITTGASRKKLTIQGADVFEHKGLTYCASCDGPLFSGKDVVVIGGGNSGFESASQLLAYAKSVTLLQRGETYRAEPTMVENILANPKMTGILNANISEVFGETFVSGIKYIDKKTDEEKTLDVAGVFVEIGAIPATSFVSKDLVEKDEMGQIIINHKNGRTSCEGIWAAGDCSDSLFKQNNIAAGDAIKAIEDLYSFLKT